MKIMIDIFGIQIESLEQELDEMEEKRKEYEEMIEEESQSQGKDLTLQEGQVSDSGGMTDVILRLY